MDHRAIFTLLARNMTLVLIGLLAFPAYAQEQETARDHQAAPASDAQTDDWTAEQQARLASGDRLLQEGRPKDAIDQAFDPVIQAYEAKYAGTEIVYYCVRTSTESLGYMLKAAAEHDRTGTSKKAMALDSTWAYGYYGKAYALIELKRVAEATEMLEKALRLSPYNPQFLSERGHLYQTQKDWQKMLESHLAAEEYVEIATPEADQDKERARALRGQGFALIELDRLDDAESVFEKSLKFDPGSQMARNELNYIKTLRKKK